MKFKRVCILIIVAVCMGNFDILLAQEVNPIKNLDGICIDEVLSLTWEAPDDVTFKYEGWLTYSTSESAGRIGAYCICDFEWMQRWSPADLEALGIISGSKITAVKFLFSGDIANYYIKIYQGNSSTIAGDELLCQEIPIDSLVESEWNVFDLIVPIDIDISKELWIGIRANYLYDPIYPIVYDSGPFAPNVNKIRLNDAPWINVEDFVGSPPAGNFMVAGFITTSEGKAVEISRYDIYQNNVKLGETIHTMFTKTDVTGEHNYCIVAVYENGNHSEENCKQIVCKVGIPENVLEKVSVYPNPASSTVTIVAHNFNKVEIYNTVGQLLQVATTEIVDVSSYNAGIYFFKIFDIENNSATKRVTVVR